MTLPKVPIMCATSAMGILARLREDLKEAEAYGNAARALVLADQISELSRLLDQGYFPPEGADLDDLPQRVPPTGAQLILRLTVPRERFEDMMGTFVEQYALDCERFGERKARWIAYIDALKSIRPLVWLAIIWLFKGAP